MQPRRFQRLRWYSCLGIITVALTGCASSDLSRTTTGQIDDAVYNSRLSMNHLTGGGGIADSYQNSTQTTKGILLGGATGAIAGGLTSSIGIIPGAAEGMIFGGAIGAYIDAHTTLEDKLKNRGVKVIVLGDNILIVLPSAMIFSGMTADIVSPAYSTLDLVAQLINRYPNMAVHIAAYTNDTGPKSVNLALTRAQASKVEKYLWRDGVNTRLLSSEGYGGTKLIEASSNSWDSGENYRVEITLQKLPV